KVYPKGVVLGKDGKPCRTCTSVQDWLKLANASTKRSQNTNTNSSTTASTTSSLTTTTASNPPLECPPDSIALGRSSWTLLHTLSATYPVAPSPAEKSTMHTFLTTFSVLYPCWPCAKDFQEWMARPENRLNGTGSWLESRERLGLWMCRAHNEVNRKLGKGEFDCGRWEERWRTGCGAEVD
ncbi:ERV/ALR sulfhydryl oxidase domain-containing protein, partial [Kalaharituber pfeilii]